MQALEHSLRHIRSKVSDRGWLRAVSAVSAALAVAASIGASSAAETKAPPQAVHLSFTAHTSSDNPVSLWAMEFAKIVAQKSNNTLLIDVHTNSTLVSQDGAYAALTSDKVDMGQVGVPQLPKTPELIGLQYLTGPFATPSWEDAIAVAQSAELRKVFNDALKPVGLRMLGICPQGYSHFMSQAPIRTVADVAGLKIRTSNADEDRAKLEWVLGAEPVIIPLGATYKALQDKTVTVVKSNVGNIYTLKWFQFAKYLDYIPMTHAFLPIMINLKSYNRLSESQRNMLETVAASSILSCSNAVRANEDEYIRRMEQEGIIVVKPDSLEEFEKAAVPLIAAGKSTPLGAKVASVLEDVRKKGAGKK